MIYLWGNMKKENIKISFIIPAYNAEKTIDRAVFSIESISELDKEIIIIENGSTDKTEQVALELASKYGNIKILKSEQGVSRARNKGIESAAGEWLCFVDADDYLADNAGKILLKYCDKIYDLIAFSYMAGKKQKSITSKERIYDKEQKNDCICNMLENPTLYMQVWAKLFKKSVIVKNKILFDDELKVAEDSDFTLHYLICCKSVCMSPDIQYHYAIDAASTMRTYSGDKLNNYINAMRCTVSSLEFSDLMLQKAVHKYVLVHFNVAMVREVFSKKCIMDFSNRYRLMKKSQKEPIFKDAMDSIRIIECFKIRFLPFIFLKLHISIVAALIYRLRAYINEKKEIT